MVKGSQKKQTNQIFINIEAILLDKKATLKNIIKLNVYLTDIKGFDVVNEVMLKLFSTPYPARALVEVSALPKGVPIEIEAVAQVPLQK